MMFLRFLIIAAAAHFVIFILFIFELKPVKQEPKVELFFWGSILRKEDLMVSSRSRERTGGSFRFSGRNRILLERSPAISWRKALGVEKPEMSMMYQIAQDVGWLKFYGPDVELDKDNVQRPPEPDILPAPPRVKLRYPGP